MAKREFNIEQGFEELDRILEQLGKDEMKLSDAVKLYSEGVALLKQCKDSLDKVEKELIILDEKEETDGI